MLLLGLVASGCGSRPASEGGFVSGDGTLTTVPPDQRRPAPRIAGETLDGARFDSAQHPGGVLVYNVWGSWCAPCRKEAPALADASKELKGTATFVGINTRDLSKEPAQAFVRAFGVPYVNVFDPDGALLLTFGRDLPPSAIPSTIVVDREGRIAARILGETTKATLTGVVTDVAEGK
uniref:TlpA family protein disulfide reductase n=1 Tax=Nigerium massiliense TaxID=1522317 RepID=UPI00058C5D7C